MDAQLIQPTGLVPDKTWRVSIVERLFATLLTRRDVDGHGLGEARVAERQDSAHLEGLLHVALHCLPDNPRIVGPREEREVFLHRTIHTGVNLILLW